MHDVIDWCAFFGAWLLFAGPVYQAALELQAEEIESDRIRRLTSSVPRPPRVSVWWWLLPPVRWVLERRRREQHQQLMLDVLSDEDYEALVRFLHKARGWVFVALGGLLIAISETYNLAESMHWSLVVFWILVVVLPGVCLGNTVALLRRSDRERKRRVELKQQRGAAPGGATPR
jgi:hypothetical protein